MANTKKKALLQYCINDFFEMNGARLKQGRKQALIKKIVAASGKDKVSQLKCLAVGKTLIIIKNGHHHAIKTVHVLSDKDKKMKINK